MAYNGKVALVTGGGSGMGQLACRNFAQTGAKVAALDINEDGLATTARGLSGITTYKVDVTDFNAVMQVVERVEEELGPIDRVFNCAAIMPFGKVVGQDPDLQQKVMSVNWGGLVNISNAVLPKMTARKHGDFVSFASMSGLIPCLLTGAYSATKAAVVFYNQNLYHENLNTGVRIACVCPPLTATPLLAQGKQAWPKTIDEEGAPIEPQEVLNAIEKGLAKGQFRIYVRRREWFGQMMVRLFPNVVWKHVHKTEGW
jgi:NAD(P)-dependent dehydrogenase (short-subunit alcohol dehydrogenase family)